MICEQCGEPIENGDEYYSIDMTGYGYFVHDWCVDDYFDELKDCCTTKYVRGEEEE